MISSYKDFTIEVINDESYTHESVDNISSYNIEYGDGDSYNSSSKHGIRISKDGQEISSSIIYEVGGSTTIHERSYLIKNDSIFICCGSMIYSLTLPMLKLNWCKELDMATCFGIYEFENDFIIHGEVEISRLSENGTIKWTFSARDIFVSMNGKKEFEIIGDTIKLIDFGNYEYILDADGNEIK
jgi:hypothetical protein